MGSSPNAPPGVRGVQNYPRPSGRLPAYRYPALRDPPVHQDTPPHCHAPRHPGLDAELQFRMPATPPRPPVVATAMFTRLAGGSPPWRFHAELRFRMPAIPPRPRIAWESRLSAALLTSA
jgi:hypothetical protein